MDGRMMQIVVQSSMCGKNMKPRRKWGVGVSDMRMWSMRGGGCGCGCGEATCLPVDHWMMSGNGKERLAWWMYILGGTPRHYLIHQAAHLLTSYSHSLPLTFAPLCVCLGSNAGLNLIHVRCVAVCVCGWLYVRVHIYLLLFRCHDSFYDLWRNWIAVISCSLVSYVDS